MRAILSDEVAIKEVLVQRERKPNKASDKDFFRECVWAIYVAHRKVSIVRGKWLEIERSLHNWDYQQVCENENEVRTTSLSVINAPRRVDAVIRIAQWMCQTGWATIRKCLLESLKQDNQGNIIPFPELITYLDELPLIGNASAIFILKNLGFDVAKPDVWLNKLAFCSIYVIVITQTIQKCRNDQAI